MLTLVLAVVTLSASLLGSGPRSKAGVSVAGAETSAERSRSAPARAHAGRCLAFDGIDDVVTVPPAPSIAYPKKGGWSVELWVKPVVYPGAETAIVVQESVGVVARDPYSIRAHPTHFSFRVDGVDGQDELAFDLPLGVWSHVAAVYRDGDARSLAVFVNGRRAGSKATSVRIERRLDPIRIGNVGREFGQPHFTGLVDDVRLWSRPLDRKGVRAAMAGDIDRSSPDLRLWLGFDEPSDMAQIALDRSPYQNHAVLGEPSVQPNPTAPRRTLGPAGR